MSAGNRGRPASNLRVMVVDDRALTDRLTAMLRETSEEIEMVGQLADPRERLDAVAALRPEVIVLDPWMPGGGGIRMLHRLRRRWSAPVIVVFTNHPYMAYRKRCLDAGADFFLDKSTQFHRLPDLLRELLDSPRRAYADVAGVRAAECRSAGRRAEP